METPAPNLVVHQPLVQVWEKLMFAAADVLEAMRKDEAGEDSTKMMDQAASRAEKVRLELRQMLSMRTGARRPGNGLGQDAPATL